MNEVFKKICNMSQFAVKKHVTEKLKETYSDVFSGDGFVFAKGTFPVLLVAHMDTVHDQLPGVILYDVQKDAMSSPNGIGGDDRCGVYMILEVIKHYNCSVLFCEDEEIGAIGASKFIETDLARELSFNYIIEFDRKGKNDAVFYDCDNEDFEDFITSDFYNAAYGTFSDISVIAPFLKCAAVNLSCGYYSAHTKQEYVVLSEMERSIEEACKILEKTTEKDKFEYIESKWSGYNWKGNGYKSNGFYDWGNGYESEDYVFDYYYLIEYYDRDNKTKWYDTYATSEAEAVGKLLMEKSTLCYNNIIDILVDKGY